MFRGNLRNAWKSRLSKKLTYSTAHSTKVLGIDLGTTNSAIAYHNPHTHTTEIIENDIAKRTTPSVVSYAVSGGDCNVLVGEVAKRQQVLNPNGTFHSTKRIIGRTYKDVVDSGDLNKGFSKHNEQVRYAIGELPNGDCGVVLPLANGKSVLKSPSEISSEILRYLSEQARTHFSTQGDSGDKLDKCVITVPAYFNDQQRQATKHAGFLAGLKVLRVINEPTAAALGFGSGHVVEGTPRENGVIAVYDLGGGTFDVSILDIEDGVFEVRSTNGDTFLGGDDFDQILVNYVIDEFIKSSDGIKHEMVYGDRSLMQRIQSACEECKIELSHVSESVVNIPFAIEGKHHIHVKVSEEKLDELSMPLIQETLKCVEKAVRDCDMDITSDIDEVLFVGGMTRMPRIRKEVSKMFNGDTGGKGGNTKMNYSINPDESVAIGAAIQGAILSGEIKDVLLLDVIPLTLGIETYGGVFSPLVARNTTIPIKVKELFSTGVDGQTGVDIRIYQGERSMCVNNQMIGDFQLRGIPPMLKGEPKIEVVFEVDADGIINVSAKETKSGVQMEISCISGGNSKQEVEKALKESAENEKYDQELQKKVELLTKLEIITRDCLKLCRSQYIKNHDEVAHIEEKLVRCNDVIADLQQKRDSPTTTSTTIMSKPQLQKIFEYNITDLKIEIMDIQQQLFEKIKSINNDISA